MQTATDSNTRHEPVRIPIWMALGLFIAIATFFLWEEHRAHILGAVPYVLLLLCPIIHLFMHRGDHAQGGTHAGHTGHRRDDGDRS